MSKPNRPAWRAHWLALATFALYTGRWGQYIVEARAYHAQPTPGGAGDALNWLLLGSWGLPSCLPRCCWLMPSGAGRAACFMWR